MSQKKNLVICVDYEYLNPKLIEQCQLLLLLQILCDQSMLLRPLRALWIRWSPLALCPPMLYPRPQYAATRTLNVPDIFTEILCMLRITILLLHSMRHNQKTVTLMWVFLGYNCVHADFANTLQKPFMFWTTFIYIIVFTFHLLHHHAVWRGTQYCPC